MNDHYTAERLLKRIFYELFGDIDAQYLSYSDRLLLAGQIKTLMNNTMTAETVLQYVTHKWSTDWKTVVNEMIANSEYHIGRVCPVETIVVAGLPGTGVEFLQRYTFNVANNGVADAKSFLPINEGNYDLYEIQQHINKPRFDFEHSFQLLEKYKDKHNVKIPVLAVTNWNKHVLNWLAYFKDMSVLKLLPASNRARLYASNLQNRLLKTHAPGSTRNTRTIDTAQGKFKNTMLNSWCTKNNIHDKSILNNTADNNLHHWFDMDTFHPSETLLLDYIDAQPEIFQLCYNHFLKEVPDLEKSLRQTASKNIVACWQKVFDQWKT